MSKPVERRMRSAQVGPGCVMHRQAMAGTVRLKGKFGIVNLKIQTMRATDVWLSAMFMRS